MKFIEETAACDPAKLGFNGGFNCTSASDQQSCTLFCPDGIEFSAHPAPAYTCQYGEGSFLPDTIPQCKYGTLQSPARHISQMVFKDPMFG